MKISLAYSPDTDDAFMVHALKEGLIDCEGYEFDFVSDDIQTLNQAAGLGKFDITAISVAAYPSMASIYELMPCGASIGQKFGPVVVVPSDSTISSVADLTSKRIAIPGRQTSAYFAACSVLPDFVAEAMPFHQISESVLNGSCDAGILIHELQLNFSSVGLKKVADLGDLWFQKFALPLPLGSNAIKRSLGPDHIRRLNEIYLRSIRWALAHRHRVVELASEAAFAGLSSPDLANRYITMYVNDDSLGLSTDVRHAIDLLLAEGASRGLCPSIDRSPFRP